MTKLPYSDLKLKYFHDYFKPSYAFVSLLLL